LAEQRVGGEDADVRVYARGRRVVVARGDVDVAAQALALAPDDERLRAAHRARTRAALINFLAAHKQTYAMLDSSTNGRLLQQSRSIRLRLSMMSMILARRGMGMNPPRRASVAEPLRCNRLTKGLKKTSCGPT